MSFSACSWLEEPTPKRVVHDSTISGSLVFDTFHLMKTILLFLSFFALPLVEEFFPAAYLSSDYTLARLLAMPCPGSAAAVSSPPRLLEAEFALPIERGSFLIPQNSLPRMSTIPPSSKSRKSPL